MCTPCSRIPDGLLALMESANRGLLPGSSARRKRLQRLATILRLSHSPLRILKPCVHPLWTGWRRRPHEWKPIR
jgi:hypothetical protein